MIENVTETGKFQNLFDGSFVVLSGHPGHIKTSLVDRLLDSDERFVRAQSVTTRKQRSDEENGDKYIFLSEEEFQKAAERGELIEFAKISDDYWGTSKQWLEDTLQRKNVVLECDWQTAGFIKQKIPYAVLIYIGEFDTKKIDSELYRPDYVIDPDDTNEAFNKLKTILSKDKV